MAARRAGSSARASSGEGDVTTGILAIRKRLELARGRRRRSVGAESGEGETLQTEERMWRSAIHDQQ